MGVNWYGTPKAVQCPWLMLGNPRSTSYAFMSCGLHDGHEGEHKTALGGEIKGWWVYGRPAPVLQTEP